MPTRVLFRGKLDRDQHPCPCVKSRAGLGRWAVEKNILLAGHRGQGRDEASFAFWTLQQVEAAEKEVRQENKQDTSNRGQKKHNLEAELVKAEAAAEGLFGAVWLELKRMQPMGSGCAPAAGEVWLEQLLKLSKTTKHSSLPRLHGAGENAPVCELRAQCWVEGKDAEAKGSAANSLPVCVCARVCACVPLV